MQRTFTIVVVAWVLSMVSIAWGQDALEAIPPETAHKFGTRLAELAAKFERPYLRKGDKDEWHEDKFTH